MKSRFMGPYFENTESNQGSRVLILRIRCSSNLNLSLTLLRGLLDLLPSILSTLSGDTEMDDDEDYLLFTAIANWFIGGGSGGSYHYSTNHEAAATSAAAARSPSSSSSTQRVILVLLLLLCRCLKQQPQPLLASTSAATLNTNFRTF